jgi:multidrug efflux pump subunit AcrA (membrane-fusion protein)
MFRHIRIWLLLGLIALAAGGGYFYYARSQASAQPASESTLQTSTVRRGSLVLSATGSGTLEAGREAVLSFPTAGKVARVEVQVGQQVTTGQVLAELEGQSALEARVASARLDLTLAEQAVSDLKANAPTSLANAQIALLDAQKAYDNAKVRVKAGWMTRCSDDTILKLQDSYEKAKERYESVAHSGSGVDYYLEWEVPAKEAMDKALVNYTYCLKYTDYEIALSQQEFTVVEAALAETQVAAQVLEQNGGIDPTGLAKAENAAVTAQLALDQAQENLAGAVMRAPFDGTVLSVNGEAGNAVGTEAFITLIDLFHPQVAFSVDETDLDKVQMGAAAEVVFDAIPETVFGGTVTQLSPSLMSVGGYQVLQGVIDLELGEAGTDSVPLLAGLNASVEIISSRAENVLLVPVEAVRVLGDGQMGVFVMAAEGQPRLRVVEVGLSDGTFTEIRSGLEMGEVVTTGAVETD